MALNLENHPPHRCWKGIQVMNEVPNKSRRFCGIWKISPNFWVMYEVSFLGTFGSKSKSHKGTFGKVFFQDGFKIPWIHHLQLSKPQPIPVKKTCQPNLGLGSVESPWTGRALLTARTKIQVFWNGFVHGFSWNVGFSVIGDPVKSSLILMES